VDLHRARNYQRTLWHGPLVYQPSPDTSRQSPGECFPHFIPPCRTDCSSPSTPGIVARSQPYAPPCLLFRSLFPLLHVLLFRCVPLTACLSLSCSDFLTGLLAFSAFIFPSRTDLSFLLISLRLSFLLVPLAFSSSSFSFPILGKPFPLSPRCSFIHQTSRSPYSRSSLRSLPTFVSSLLLCRSSISSLFSDSSFPNFRRVPGFSTLREATLSCVAVLVSVSHPRKRWGNVLFYLTATYLTGGRKEIHVDFSTVPVALRRPGNCPALT